MCLVSLEEHCFSDCIFWSLFLLLVLSFERLSSTILGFSYLDPVEDVLCNALFFMQIYLWPFGIAMGGFRPLKGFALHLIEELSKYLRSYVSISCDLTGFWSIVYFSVLYQWASTSIFLLLKIAFFSLIPLSVLLNSGLSLCMGGHSPTWRSSLKNSSCIENFSTNKFWLNYKQLQPKF